MEFISFPFRGNRSSYLPSTHPMPSHQKQQFVDFVSDPDVVMSLRGAMNIILKWKLVHERLVRDIAELESGEG